MSKQPKPRVSAIAGALLASALGALTLHGAVTGQWDFDNGDLSATTGSALAYLDGNGGETAQQTDFGTTTALGISDIDGEEAKVMKFPASITPMGYAMPTPDSPNGGGTLVNQWTIIYDLNYPASSDGTWRALLEVDERLTADSDFFVNPVNGIGISGQYDGTVVADTWHRIVLVVDQEANVILKFIDGLQVGTQAADGVDGRWAFNTVGVGELFNDDDGDANVGYVNSIQLRDGPLTPGQVRALGGASAAGIPAVIPAIPPFILSADPAPGELNVSPKPLIKVELDSGDETIAQDSIKLLLNGEDTSANIVAMGKVFDISYQVPGLLDRQSVQKLELVYEADVSGPATTPWSFVVADYSEIELPEPLVLENFDAVEQEELPAGWTVENETDVLNPGFDLTDPNSDSYLDFVVISSETLSAVFGGRRFNMFPWVVNGVPLTSLVSGNFAYAESDNRGGSQVQVITSPDFDVSGETDIYVAFYSTYEQNQDSLGAVEYSIDGGQTWLPALYMLEEADVVLDEDGNIDAVATMTAENTDAAHGLPYGTFIGAEITEALAPFISPRVNDDSFESKRVERLRLEQADDQSRVRLRFTQTGTSSWYFGIDEVGFYSISEVAPSVTTQPVSQTVSAGATVELSVVTEGTEPLAYQWKFNGENIANATEATYTIQNVQAGNSGLYLVEITNEVGSTASSPANLAVFLGPIEEDLVVHLKFDDDLDDSSGQGNNGAEEGIVDYVAGQIGQAMIIESGLDYVTLGAPTDLDFALTTDFSFSFWVRLPEGGWTSDPALISNKDWNSGGNQGYVIATAGDGHLQWNLAGAPDGRKDYDGPPGTFGNDDWQYVAMTFDRNGNASTYVNGELKNITLIGDNENNVNTPADLATNLAQDGTGAYGPAFIDLSMDDLGIWRRLLTAQEVGAIHALGLEGKDLSQVEPPAQSPVLTYSVEGNTLTLSWNVGNLQSAAEVQGAYSDVDGATSPLGVPMTEAQEYYRVEVP